jgi:hypothetical protein
MQSNLGRALASAVRIEHLEIIVRTIEHPVLLYCARKRRDNG